MKCVGYAESIIADKSIFPKPWRTDLEQQKDKGANVFLKVIR